MAEVLASRARLPEPWEPIQGGLGSGWGWPHSSGQSKGEVGFLGKGHTNRVLQRPG